MSWKPWSRIDDRGLARFVTPEATHWLTLDISHFDITGQPDERRLLVEAIYKALLKKNIRYAFEEYHPAESLQQIRTPAEILDAPREGTCLDLAALFCGLCLGNELLPILIVNKGHALVAVSMTYGLREWNSYRSERALFETGPLTDLAPLRELIDDGSYIAVECTGFAHSELLGQISGEAPPESMQRVDGILSFERAVAAGREQLDLPTRPFQFALDVAVAHYAWRIESYALDRTAGSTIPFDELPRFERFVGRRNDLNWLLERLRQGGVTSITALGGMGGLGKTRLAAEAIYEIRREGCFPDGIAVVSCLGRTDAIEVLQNILARFDPQRRLPQMINFDGLIDSAHLLLDRKSTLIVLDNVEPDLDIEKVVALLKATPTTLLLTARQTLPYTVVPEGGNRRLDLLSSEEAFVLFAQSFGQKNWDYATPEHTSVKRIVEFLGRHTLAVKLAGAYAGATGRNLRLLAEELEDPNQAIDLWDGETPQGLIRVFDRSLNTLPRDARRLFDALATFGTNSFGRQAVLALAKALGLARPAARLDLLILRRLVDISLITDISEQGDWERLSLHPLMRALAARKFDRWTLAKRNSAYRGLALFYAHYANGKSHYVLSFDITNITGSLEWAHTIGENELLVNLCLCIHNFLYARSRTNEARRYLPWGIAEAEIMSRVADKRENILRAAQLGLTYGQVLRDVGELEEAERNLTRVREIYHQEQEQKGESRVLTFLGQIIKDRGQLEKACQYFERSLEIQRKVGDVEGQSWNLSYLGRVAQYREQMRKAKQYYEDSLAMKRELKDQRSEAWILGWLGQIAVAQGSLIEAENYYQKALSIHQQNQDKRGEASIPHLLGRVAELQEQLDEAKSYYEASLTIFREINDVRSIGWRLCDVGRVLQAQNLANEAERYYKDGLRLLRKVYDKQGEGEALICLGRLAIAQRDLDEASPLLQQALIISQEVEYKSGECLALSFLSQIALNQGQYDVADKLLQRSIDIMQKGENWLLQGRLYFLKAVIAEAKGNLDHVEDLYHNIISIVTRVRRPYVTNSLLSYSP